MNLGEELWFQSVSMPGEIIIESKFLILGDLFVYIEIFLKLSAILLFIIFLGLEIFFYLISGNGSTMAV